MRKTCSSDGRNAPAAWAAVCPAHRQPSDAHPRRHRQRQVSAPSRWDFPLYLKKLRQLLCTVVVQCSEISVTDPCRTQDSGSGSCFCLQWAPRYLQKLSFFQIFGLLLTVGTFPSVLKDYKETFFGVYFYVLYSTMLRLWHWQPDTQTTPLDLIHYRNS